MAANQGNDNKAQIYGLIGATGCGKSTELRKRLNKKKRPRTLIWSPKEPIDQYVKFYPGSILVRTAGEVYNVVRAAGPRGEFHLVFQPKLNRKIDTENFDIVCKVLMTARNVTVVAEELHTVVLPSWSPDGWNQLIMMGRGYGAEVFGLSQRPASVDKAFFGNVSSLRCGRLNDQNDITVMAKSLRVPAGDIAALDGYKWIERDMLTGKTTRG